MVNQNDTPPTRQILKKLREDASTEQLIFALNEAVEAYAHLAAESTNVAFECRDHMLRCDRDMAKVFAEITVLGVHVRSIEERADDKIVFSFRQHIDKFHRGVEF